jgi:hypothetical protein
MQDKTIFLKQASVSLCRNEITYDRQSPHKKYRLAECTTPPSNYYSNANSSNKYNIPSLRRSKRILTDEKSKKMRRKRTKKIQSKNFTCSKCLKTFSHGRNRNQHEKFECHKAPRFQCPYCDYKSKWVTNVHSHIRRKHEYKAVYSINLKNT